jgi:hypothetical protein
MRISIRLGSREERGDLSRTPGKHILRSMDNDKHALDPSAALEASGDYRMLRKLPRRREFAPDVHTGRRQ